MTPIPVPPSLGLDALSPAVRRRRRRLVLLASVAAAGVLLVSAARPFAPRQQTAAATPPAPQAVASAPAAKAGAASPLEAPLRLIAEARKSYEGVRDYTCVMVKRERLRGQLQPESAITMKVRTEPFSVYLRWQQPRQQAGQQACYVAGKNNGMMRVHATGLLGAAGWVSLNPNDARTRQNSNHTITEAGIGNLIERFAKAWEAEKDLNRTEVRLAEYEYNKRRCTRAEIIHPDNADGRFQTHRSVLYFDKETRLPIRVEAYDWPRRGGAAGGELLEVYSYVNLKLNVGLGDEAFNY